jgi:uncharacterized C2H2 Zn-finger protein
MKKMVDSKKRQGKHVIRCPDDGCRGTLVDRFLGIVQCSRCGKVYQMRPVSERMLRKVAPWLVNESAVERAAHEDLVSEEPGGIGPVCLRSWLD